MDAHFLSLYKDRIYKCCRLSRAGATVWALPADVLPPYGFRLLTDAECDPRGFVLPRIWPAKHPRGRGGSSERAPDSQITLSFLSPTQKRLWPRHRWNLTNNNRPIVVFAQAPPTNHLQKTAHLFPVTLHLLLISAVESTIKSSTLLHAYERGT